MTATAEPDRIIGALYDAALNPDLWKPALAALAVWTGSDAYHLLRWNKESQRATFNLHTDGYEGAIEAYGSYYGTIDPRSQRWSDNPAGQVIACQRLFEDGYVARSEFYQDFLVRWGMRRTLSSRVLGDGTHEMLLALLRSDERDAFDDEQVARLQRVMPHLCRAGKLWQDTQQLRELAALGQHVADASGMAVLGLDAAGTVVHANAQAEALLREADSLCIAAGRLSASDAADAARLQRVIAQAASGAAARDLALAGRRSGPQACFVNVARLPAGAPLQPLFGRASVLVTARRRGQRPVLAPQRLAQAFGLTPAECSVALALLEGKTPTEYADEALLSMSTVRTHLRAIFEKTNTRRQAETVRVLRDLPF